LFKVSPLISRDWLNGRLLVPAFHERSLSAEGNAAAFRIEVGGGSATAALPQGAGDNEIAKFLSEAIGLAKQMQSAMGGGAPIIEILVAEGTRQSALKVSLEVGGTAVTMQPGGGHLVAMLQHFLMALNPPSRNAA
jgi:hypothetical protein